MYWVKNKIFEIAKFLFEFAFITFKNRFNINIFFCSFLKDIISQLRILRWIINYLHRCGDKRSRSSPRLRFISAWLLSVSVRLVISWSSLLVIRSWPGEAGVRRGLCCKVLEDGAGLCSRLTPPEGTLLFTLSTLGLSDSLCLVQAVISPVLTSTSVLFFRPSNTLKRWGLDLEKSTEKVSFLLRMDKKIATMALAASHLDLGYRQWRLSLSDCIQCEDVDVYITITFLYVSILFCVMSRVLLLVSEARSPNVW